MHTRLKSIVGVTIVVVLLIFGSFGNGNVDIFGQINFNLLEMKLQFNNYGDANVSRTRNFQPFEMMPQIHPPYDANISRVGNLNFFEMTPQIHPNGDANVSRLKNLQLFEVSCLHGTAIIVDPGWKDSPNDYLISSIIKSLSKAGFLTTEIRSGMNVTIEWLKNGLNHEIVFWRGHGTKNASSPIMWAFWTCEEVTPETLIRYADDINNGRVLQSDDKHWGITSKFIKHYYGENSFKNSLFYAEACYSLEFDQEDSMVDALIDCGVRAYVGYESWVEPDAWFWSGDADAQQFFYDLCNRGYTVNQAVGNNPWWDPLNSRNWRGDGNLKFGSILVDTTSLGVVVHSPAEIFLTDPLGRHVGKDPGTKQIIIEVPDAIYVGGQKLHETDPRMIWIPENLDGTYNISLVGIGYGSYNLTTCLSSISGTYAKSLTGTIVKGQLVTYYVHVQERNVNLSGGSNWEISFMGSGGYPIVDFAVYNGMLYAAAHSTLYVYDGSRWNIIDSPSYVTSLEAYHDKLVIGGKGGLYLYNGTIFTLIFSASTYIKTLGVYNETLYVGTFLDNPPKLYYCNGIPEDPNSWQIDYDFSEVLNFSGPFGSIDSFAVYDSKLYITSGSTIYSHNGTNWSIAKKYDDVYAYLDIEVCNGKLYLATRDQAWRKPYYQGGTGFSGRVIEYDGSNWTTIFDHEYWVFSLETYDNKLYAGTANKIYTYDGANWNLSFNVIEDAYYAIAFVTFDGKIFAGMGNGCIFVDPAFETITLPEYPTTTFPSIMTLFLTLVLAFKKKKKTSENKKLKS